jgi:predicted transcriptional regulator of viral defense system/very-short-patch-repair endonuclease
MVSAMADVRSVTRQDDALTRERRLAHLAGRQHGLVATWQLTRLGVSRNSVRNRVRKGQLQRLHRGVYAVGHGSITRLGRWMAGVLACGAEAVLSHRSAARLWGLIDWGEIVEVTINGRSGRARPGIKVHCSDSLLNADRTIRNGIPVTSVARTLLDLAAVASRSQTERAMEAADRQGLLHFRALYDLLARNRGHHGLRHLLPLIAQYRGVPDVRSPMERDFLDLCRAHGLPEPQMNVLVEGELVDAHWPKQQLIVELDSRGYHSSPRAFERDHSRDLKLKLAGYEVLRLTRRQLNEDPAFIASTVRTALSRADERSRRRAA